MNIICIIPARDGSKRIPGKNIVPLLGVPLIEHTIHHAKASKYINQVLVYSDGEDIREASRKAGAATMVRPPEISRDHDQPESALIIALSNMEAIYNVEYDLLVFLQCTSPIRRKGDIDNVIEKSLELKTSIYSATATWHYIIHDGYGNWYAEHERARSQDRKPALAEDGSIYVLSPNELKKHNNRMNVHSMPYIIPWWCGLEIDEEEDIETCELIMRWKQSELAWMPVEKS